MSRFQATPPKEARDQQLERLYGRRPFDLVTDGLGLGLTRQAKPSALKRNTSSVELTPTEGSMSNDADSKVRFFRKPDCASLYGQPMKRTPSAAHGHKAKKQQPVETVLTTTAVESVVNLPVIPVPPKDPKRPQTSRNHANEYERWNEKMRKQDEERLYQVAALRGGMFAFPDGRVRRGSSICREHAGAPRVDLTQPDGSRQKIL